MTTITGTVADGFEPVRDAFQANFDRHGELGAGVAVYVDGELVVDLVGGVADEANGTSYGPDALQLVFSTTKGAAAVCANLLAQRGELDLEAPVMGGVDDLRWAGPREGFAVACGRIDAPRLAERAERLAERRR